jgi:hypothetical protein
MCDKGTVGHAQHLRAGLIKSPATAATVVGGIAVGVSPIVCGAPTGTQRGAPARAHCSHDITTKSTQLRQIVGNGLPPCKPTSVCKGAFPSASTSMWQKHLVEVGGGARKMRSCSASWFVDHGLLLFLGGLLV